MKGIDKLYNSISYIVLGGFILAYFIFYALSFEKPILDIFTDYKSILHLVFVVVVNVMTVNLAFDKGLEIALNNDEFKKADVRNNEIIKYINNNFDSAISYIEMLNNAERNAVDKDFMFSIGKTSLDNLTRKEMKQYKKIKPKQYTTRGMNLPLYYEHEKGNKQSFDASFKVGGNKTTRLTKKAFTGFLFGFMTVEVVFVFNNLGQAISSTIILASGMVTTYLLNFYIPIMKLTKETPKKVDNKETFYLGLKDFINNKKVSI